MASRNLRSQTAAQSEGAPPSRRNANAGAASGPRTDSDTPGETGDINERITQAERERERLLKEQRLRQVEKDVEVLLRSADREAMADRQGTTGELLQ